METTTFTANSVQDKTKSSSSSSSSSSASSASMYQIPELPAELSAWIHSIYVVTFDIEFGQAIENLHPHCATQFHFKMRLSKLDERLKRFYSYYNTQTTLALNVDPQFIYGYVHFLQKRDTSLKRGYFQKSLVILSLLPFVDLFYNVVTIVGTFFFEKEQLLNLETIYNQTKKWPSLRTGNVLNLTIMGSTLAFYIPNKDDKLNNLHSNLSLTPTSSLTAFDLDLYKCFYPVISDLQLLWEMILTCEPFIVIAHTPDVCANFVQALISLIYPFKYDADYRPFFTIHDPEFRDYIGLKENTKPPNVILGVTNPFFAKSLERWPNVIQLCSMTSSKSSDQLSSLLSSLSSKPQQQQAPQIKIPFVDRLRFTTTEAYKLGLNTKAKPFLHKDRNFLTKILRSNKAHLNNRPNNIQTALIRRWLIELTQSFFMPLERYLTQLMPLHNKISPFKAPPKLPTFDFEAFLATLDTSGPQLTTKIKGDWLGLYKKFFTCSNFYSWYYERKSEIDRKLWSLHMESFLDIDLPQAIKSKGEVEVVDMIIFLKRRLAQAISKSHEYQFTCTSLDQFKFKLAELINTLPEDLRTLFLQS